MSDKLLVIDEVSELSVEAFNVIHGAARPRPGMYQTAYNELADYLRLQVTSVIVCVVCDRAIEIRSQEQHDAAIEEQCHLGACWHALKRGFTP